MANEIKVTSKRAMLTPRHQVCIWEISVQGADCDYVGTEVQIRELARRKAGQARARLTWRRNANAIELDSWNHNGWFGLNNDDELDGEYVGGSNVE